MEVIEESGAKVDEIRSCGGVVKEGRWIALAEWRIFGTKSVGLERINRSEEKIAELGGGSQARSMSE